MSEDLIALFTPLRCCFSSLGILKSSVHFYGPRLTPSLPACSNVYVNYVNEVTTQVITQYYKSSSTTYDYNEIQQIVQQVVSLPGSQAELPGTGVTISAQGEHVLGAWQSIRCPWCLHFLVVPPMHKWHTCQERLLLEADRGAV